MLLLFLLLTASPEGSPLASKRETGLVLEVEPLAGFTAGASPRDCRVARLLALHVPDGSPPTPFLAPGPFRATGEGYVEVELFDDYTFSAEGRGSLSLEIDGRPALEARGETLFESAPREAIELEAGTHRVLFRYESPREGEAWFRVLWSSPDFAPEPVPPPSLSHDPLHPLLLERTRARRGRGLVASRSCLRCHAPPGARGALLEGMPELDEKGPSLEGIGSRLHAAWMAGWIADPRALRPDARMPRLFPPSSAGSRARDVAAYLATLRPGGGEEAPAVPGAGAASRGRDLFADLGCIACHVPEALDPEVREPEVKEPARRRLPLALLGRKWKPAALVEYLLRPEAFHRSTRMPNFRLSGMEALDLAAFLVAEGVGETAGDFPEGDPAEGRRLVQTSGCLACHELQLADLSRPPGPEALTATPRRPGCLAETASERGGAPDFSFSGEEREALRAFLREGLDSLKRSTPAEYARRKIEELRCGACHVLDGALDTWSSLKPDPGKRGVPVFLQTRPGLTFTGEKLRTEWLRRFLLGEGRLELRPWLKARMPVFSLRADLLAQGLSHEHGFPAQEEAPGKPVEEPPAEMAEKGGRLLEMEGFACLTCHDAGDRKASGAFDARGIDLKHTTERLRKRFFHRFLLNPQRIDPGTKMLQFTNGGRSPIGAIYQGDARRQFEAIWEHLRRVAERGGSG